MEQWQRDKEWADGYWPEIERVVRSVAGAIINVENATPEEDKQFATDYVVTVSSGEIACRVRSWEYWLGYGDITLRYSRPSGIVTEFEKIRQGFCRWYLYAWAVDEKRFGAWVFLDLDALRKSGLLEQEYRPIAVPGGATLVPLGLGSLIHHGCIMYAGGQAKGAMGAFQP